MGIETRTSGFSVASLNLHGLYKSCSVDSRNEQSPTFEVVHETSKAHFRNLLSNRFLPSQLIRHWPERSGGLGFNLQCGQFLTNLFCSSLCKETPIVKNSNIYEHNVKCRDNWSDYLLVRTHASTPCHPHVLSYVRLIVSLHTKRVSFLISRMFGLK